MMSGRIGTTAGHVRGKTSRNFCVYSVYDAKTTLPVIIDGSAAECARAMGIKLSSFYYAVYRFRKGLLKRWEIYQEYADGYKDFRKGAASGG